MSNFLNQSPEKSKKLHEPIYKNAQKLKKDALLIANQNKSYSTASSLLILSSEEIIKAMLVLLHSEGYSVYRIKDAKKFFSDHKIRHKLAQIMEMGVGIFESFTKYAERDKALVFKLKNESWNSFLNGALDLLMAAEPVLNSLHRFNELKKFDSYKQKGFYVDFFNELLVPSKQIKEKTFTKSIDIANRLFMFYKGLNILHHPKFKNHFDEKEINKIKKQLKELIDNNMDGFIIDNK